jgi:ankyrin repeat protein
MVVVCLASASVAMAHETDQTTLPLGRPFAEMRGYFTADVHAKIERAVDKTNARIRRSLRDGEPTEETRRLQSPDVIAKAVYDEFPLVINHVETLEITLRGSGVRDDHPGGVVAHMPTFWIYHHPLLMLDPTKLIRLSRCSTVMIDGVLLGNDKFVHFVHMGHINYTTYRASLAAGKDEAQALQDVVDLGTGAHPFLSEGTLLGMLTTGVWSNADLAANYCGMKFFRNLTEAVSVRGAVRAPMLQRRGEFYTLADHVRPESDFLAVFVSDHWNEALNPNHYAFGMGGFVAEGLRKRCDDVIDWYVDDRGRRRSREDFLALAEELRTYYGENYGYKGDPRELVGIGTTCFADDDRSASRHPSPSASDTGSRLLRRSELWWAARAGDLAGVEACLGRGMPVDAADIDGYTPLHIAADQGHAEVVARLLAAGAGPGLRTRHGLTPLHLAAKSCRRDAATKLIARGAPVNATDSFGCTPLHDVARTGDTALAAMLIGAGALANATDRHGSSPLHRAARAGSRAMVGVLIRAGADPRLVNRFGARAADEATASRHTDLLEVLAEAEQRLAAGDDGAVVPASSLTSSGQR